MKKGKVISSALSHKNGSKILRAGDKVTEDDLNNFDEAVKGGHVEIEEEESDLMKLKKDDLQEKCIELNLDYNDSDNKADLVALIEGSEKPE